MDDTKRNNVKLISEVLQKAHNRRSRIDDVMVDNYRNELRNPRNNYINLKLSLYLNELTKVKSSVDMIPNNIQNSDLPIQEKTFKQYCNDIEKVITSDQVGSFIDNIYNIETRSSHYNESNIYKLIVDQPFAREYLIRTLLQDLKPGVKNLQLIPSYIINFPTVSYYIDYGDSFIQEIDPDYVKSLLNHSRVIVKKIPTISEFDFYDSLPINGRYEMPHLLTSIEASGGSVSKFFVVLSSAQDEYYQFKLSPGYLQILDYLAYKCLKHDINFIDAFRVIGDALYRSWDYDTPIEAFETINDVFMNINHYKDIPFKWAIELMDLEQLRGIITGD